MKRMSLTAVMSEIRFGTSHQQKKKSVRIMRKHVYIYIEDI